MRATDELFRVLSIFKGNCKVMHTDLQSDCGRRGLKLETTGRSIVSHRYVEKNVYDGVIGIAFPRVKTTALVTDDDLRRELRWMTMGEEP